MSESVQTVQTIELSPETRRALRARAHALNPVVSIAENGLTESVLDEIDRCLKAHELIKIRVYGDDRTQREAFMNDICSRLGAAPVQQIGKLLVVWRELPAAKKAAKPAPRGSSAKRPVNKRAMQGNTKK